MEVGVSMGLVIGITLYTFAILTLVRGYHIYICNKDAIKRNQYVYILYGIATVFSSLWSFGYAMIWLQMDLSMARVWRAVGMIGVFLLFAFITEFLVQWLEGARVFKNFVRAFATLGIFLWPFVISEESVTFYEHELIGITYQFSQNIWNTLYNAYAVLVGINLFIIGFYILRQAKRKKLRDIIKMIIKCIIVVMLGMVFDTLLPIFGFDAMPGSTLAQGIGVYMVAGALEFHRKSEITVENMSEFVYFSVEAPVLIFDEKRCIKIANNGAMEFFKEYKNGLEDKKIHELFAVSENCFDFGEDKKSEEAECLLNNRYCHIGISKIFDEYYDVIGYIVVLNDLTEKRDIIQKLQASEQEAERANKAKSDFLANMSHEIRTPINGVIGMNEMILQKSNDREITEYARMVKRSANNLMELVNDILDISKIEANRMIVLNEDYKFRTFLGELQTYGNVKSMDNNITFKLNIKGGVPKVLNGDEKKLRQIVLNVVSNAIKYTEKGSVTVDVDAYDENEKKYIRFVVSDTGIGIKKDNLPKIFDAFERVDSDRNTRIIGTGLGLSIVKKLVGLMNGQIFVESEYKKGSVFKIAIPQEMVGEDIIYNLDDEPDDTETDYLQINLDIPEKNILVVDDNEINRFVASELLAYTNAKIDTAQSGMECLECVKNKHYDFIFLDHIMPEMDGIQTLYELKKMNISSDTKIIILTANAIQGAREDYISKGFDDYLSKPIDMKQVETVLRRYI